MSNKSCYTESTNSYKCDSCVFSRNENIACANPRIWEKPPRDAYFKSRSELLTEVEVKSISDHL